MASRDRQMESGHESERCALELTGELRLFVAQYAPTYDQIQILLHLHSRRDSYWTSSQVSEDLHLPGSIAVEALQHMCERGLLCNVGGPPPAFAYVHQSQEIDNHIQALANANECERAHLDHVIVSGGALIRMRKSLLLRFADLLGREASAR